MGLTLRSRFRQPDLAIDLGTDKTAIYRRGEGIVMQQQSVISLSTRRSGLEVVAIGDEAAKMQGKEPHRLQTIKPLKRGVIEHLDATVQLLNEMARQSNCRTSLIRPRVLIGAPAGISDIERRAVQEAARAFHPRSIQVIQEPLAAAIGAGLDIAENQANMIVDIGGGITEVMVLSLGEVVLFESVRVGGDDITEAIIQYCRKDLSLLIGEQTANEIKARLGDPMGARLMEQMTVRGIDVHSRLPRMKNILASKLRPVILTSLQPIVAAVQRTLENTPPMLAADLIDRGITLSGGTALLHNFNHLLALHTGLSIKIADDPMGAVVRGAGMVLEAH